MGNCFGTRGGHDFSPEAAAAQRPSPRGGLRFSVSSGGGGGGGGGAYAPPKAPAGKPGERYTALYMYNPDFPEALSFPADESIIVTGKIDRFTLLGYCESKPGSIGQFPATYVEKAKPDDRIVYPFKNPNFGSRPKISNIGAVKRHRRKLKVQWDDKMNEVVEAFAKQEYDRCGDFNPEKSQNEWELEEEEEIRRQLQVRWQTFERHLAPGTKCGERAKFERIESERNRAENDAKAERKRIFLEKRAAKKMVEQRAASRLSRASLNQGQTQAPHPAAGSPFAQASSAAPAFHPEQFVASKFDDAEC